jgi:NADH-ubiquinone oxidoreductase chain 2
MEWKSLLVFLSIQKVAPIFLITSSIQILVLSFVLIISSIRGTLIQLTSINLKTLIVYSSISHSSWILLGAILSKPLIIIYFLIYSLILIYLIFSFIKRNSESIVKEEKNKDLIISLLSFGGTPPLLGFIPKWIILIAIFLQNYLILIAFIIILITCINSFIYIRIFLVASTNTPYYRKAKPKNNHSGTLINVLPSILIFTNLY